MHFISADNENSDHAARMRRLIWVFVVHLRQMVHFIHVLAQIFLSRHKIYSRLSLSRIPRDSEIFRYIRTSK